MDRRFFGSVLSTVMHVGADKSAREGWPAVIPLD